MGRLQHRLGRLLPVGCEPEMDGLKVSQCGVQRTDQSLGGVGP